PRRVDDVVFTVSAELPGDPTGLGEKTAVVPAGRPATVSETLPTEPPTTDTPAVYLADCPREIVTDEGLTDSAKSRAETASVTVTVAEPPRAVPAIVSGSVPPGAAGNVVTVSCERPAPAMTCGLKLAVPTPDGSPVSDNATSPAKPLSEPTPTV